MKRLDQRGFTLLEMVIAIAIFAIIGAISYVTLNQFLQTRETLVKHNEQTRNLQRLFTLLESDIRYMTLRSVRDGLGEVLDPLIISSSNTVNQGDIFEFTTVVPSIQSNRWHRLLRANWALDEGSLIRQTWNVLDRDFDSQSVAIILLDDVSSIEVNYFLHNQESGLIQNASEWDTKTKLPIGVEVVLRLIDETVYRRVIEVAGGA